LFEPRVRPKTFAIMPASKPRSFRHRVGSFQLSHFFSGCYTFRGAFRFSRAGSDRHAIPDEAGISKRPFANPKRLPGCGPPLRDRSSRPAPSMRLPDSACGPFDCGLPPSPPVSRGGGIHRPQSVAVSFSGTPAGPPGLAPLQDLSILPVRYSTWFTCRKLAYATRTRPVTPLRRWLLSVEAGRNSNGMSPALLCCTLF
jgi:hypothetical protein